MSPPDLNAAMIRFSPAVLWNMIRKDSALLLRSREYLFGSFALAGGLFLFYRFLLPPGNLILDYLPVSFFAACQISGLFLVFGMRLQEKEWEAGRAVMMLRIDAAWIYTSAFLALSFSLLLLFLFALIIWLILYLPVALWPSAVNSAHILFILLVMSIAIGAIGPLLASLSSYSSLGHLLLLILYFPLGLPVVSGSAQAMRAALSGNFQITDMGLPLSFAAVYYAAGMVLSGVIAEE